jgi:hypothetical protein
MFSYRAVTGSNAGDTFQSRSHVLEHFFSTVAQFVSLSLVPTSMNTPKRPRHESVVCPSIVQRWRAGSQAEATQISLRFSKQPNPRKQSPHEDEEADPHLPANACPFRHTQHPPHRPAQLNSRPLELIVNRLRQTARIPDLIANRYGELFQLPHLLRKQRRRCGVVLGFQ